MSLLNLHSPVRTTSPRRIFAPAVSKVAAPTTLSAATSCAPSHVKPPALRIGSVLSVEWAESRGERMDVVVTGLDLNGNAWIVVVCALYVLYTHRLTLLVLFC